jgi:Hemerythrin HHE cation binding domain
MPGALYQYLTADHDRFDALLKRAMATPGKIDMDSYSEFRRGLLRHIAIEEKIVLPAIAKSQGGRKADVAERLRLDHSAIAALLVPPPSEAIIRTLRSIFEVHNPLEESAGGLYELFERSSGAEVQKLLSDLKTAPEVLVLPYNEKPEALESTRRAVVRAGYEFRTS